MTDKQGMTSPLISTRWLADNLGDETLRILDCTIVQQTAPDGGYAFAPGREAYEKSHIPGAVFCNVLAELRDPDNPLPLMMPKPDAFAKAMEALGVGEGTRVVVYDRGAGMWAARVWWSLKVFGFDNAAVLDGGWTKWTAENRPISAERPSPAPARFIPRHRPHLIASKTEVREAIGAADAKLVHSLSNAEFTGDTVRMPRAGRIAGSVNVPASSLIDPSTNAYLAPDALKAKFETAGATGEGRIITYCGGGVAACSTALALAMLGAGDVAVYDGSLAEWTADPDAPMEVG